MVSPFLLRDILDVAIPENRDELLIALVAGMIGISVATGVLGVGQTWLTNVVGQRVMHDLRTQVYRHLQRLSLAFFTRTRTGEIQSRIANDIGGVQNVVTSTAASIVSNVTTVIAQRRRDVAARLAARAVLARAAAVLRAAGAPRRQPAAQDHDGQAGRDGRHLLARAGVAVGLRASCSARRWAAAPSWPTASSASRRTSPTSRSARGWPGRWMMAAIQTSFAVMPALVYLFAGLAPGAASIGTIVAFTTLQTRLFFPVQSLLSRRRGHPDLDGAVRPRLRVPGPRRSTSSRATRDAGRTSAARSASTASGSATATSGRCATSTSTVPAGTRTALVGETGAGKTTLGYLAARLYDPEQGAVRIDGTDLRELTLRRAGRRGRRRLAGDLPVPRLGAREPALRQARTRPTRRSRTPPARPRSTTRSRRCPTATTPSSASAASASPAARSSGSRSPARSCATRRCSCSTRPRARWTSQTERAVGEALERLAEGRTTIVIAHRLSHRPRRRPDRRARPRRGRRARHPRGAARARRALRGARRARRRRRDQRVARQHRRAPIRLSSRAARIGTCCGYGEPPPPMRRPSPAMLVALLALFVALGGPAQARRLIDGADIKQWHRRAARRSRTARSPCATSTRTLVRELRRDAAELDLRPACSSTARSPPTSSPTAR